MTTTEWMFPATSAAAGRFLHSILPTAPSNMEDEASYVCDTCGEEIVIPVDPAAGSNQEYVEDCPVCCNPCVVRVTLADDGRPDVSSSAEQDRF